MTLSLWRLPFSTKKGILKLPEHCSDDGDGVESREGEIAIHLPDIVHNFHEHYQKQSNDSNTAVWHQEVGHVRKLHFLTE